MSSKHTNNRRLAAIIFADIVGYTAMMQHGEKAALQAIKRFESVTREFVDKYQGEIIKNYGDGSLLLFDSTVQAVQCAHDMQIAFREAPKVPLRIGIHVGEVVRRDNDVFGHGVNISSRIESLGVAGSVLVSKMIYDKVRNQENFTFKSMGVFDFKNVDEGMQVYALTNKGITVPRASEMKGKVKEVKETQSFWSNPIYRAVGVAALVLVLGVGGFSLLNKSNAQGPITETVTYLDENGNEKSRLVYNRSLSNRVMLYAPKNVGPAFEDEKWNSLLVSELLMLDMEQDNRMLVLNPLSIANDMKSKGLEDFTDISFKLKRKFAADRYVDYFVDSDISKEGSDYTVTFRGYVTKDGKKVLEKVYTNADLTSIVDGFTADFNEFLYSQIEQSGTSELQHVDLPARELLSGNMDASIEYVKATHDRAVNKDYAGMLASLDRALEKDPKFFKALADKGTGLCITGNATEGIQTIEESLKYIDGQPERNQLALKSQYYFFQNDMKKGLRIAEQWKKLYPQNEEAYRVLASVYQMTGDFKKYEKTYKDGYDFGHKGNFLLNLGTIHTEKEEFDQALKYFEEFQKLYPEKTGEIKQLGNLYLKQGDFDKAIEYFENRTLLDNQSVSNFTTLGEAYLKKGDFENARSSYSTALNRSKTLQDSVSALGAISNIDFLEGRSADYIKRESEKNKLIAKVNPPLMADMQFMNTSTIARYKDCGALDIIDNVVKRMEGYDMGQINWGCISRYNLALGTKNPDLLRQCKEDCQSDIDKAITGSQAKLLAAFESSLLKEYDASKKEMLEFMEETNTPRAGLNPFFADINIETGEYAEAIGLMKSYVEKDRSSAESYILLAKAYKGNGNIKEAGETIQKALNIWKNADEEFSLLVEANELLAELN